MKRDTPERHMSPEQVREVAASFVEQMRGNWQPADQAMIDLVDAVAHVRSDPLRAQLLMRGAQVNATLAHREAVLELTATIREVSGRLADSNADVSDEIRRVA